MDIKYKIVTGQGYSGPVEFTSFNDFKLFTTIFPDLYLSAHTCLAPKTYDKDPLFVPPFVAISSDGYIGDDQFNISLYKWVISRWDDNTNQNRIVQVERITRPSISTSTNPAKNTNLTLIFPSCTSISLSNELENIQIDGNKMTLLFNPKTLVGEWTIPFNTEITFTIKPEAFIFRQWNTLDISKSYPKKIYGFYKKNDSNSESYYCVPYNEEVLNTLNSDPYDTSWALVGEACNVYLENNKNFLQSAETKITTSQYELPEYITEQGEDENKMYGSYLFRFNKYPDDPQELKHGAYLGIGLNQNETDAKWRITKDGEVNYFNHMNFGASYLDWSLAGIYDNKNDINLPDLSNDSNAMYVMVGVSNYALAFNRNSSSKSISIQIDESKAKANASAAIYEAWEISESVTYYYGKNNNDLASASPITGDDKNYLKQVFEISNALLTCSNVNASKLGDYYYHNVESERVVQDNNQDYTTNFLIDYYYKISLSGFKGDIYYMSYRTNKTDDEFGLIWKDLFLKAGYIQDGVVTNERTVCVYEPNNKRTVQPFFDTNVNRYITNSGNGLTTSNTGLVYPSSPINIPLYNADKEKFEYGGWAALGICLNQAISLAFIDSGLNAWSDTVSIDSGSGVCLFPYNYNINAFSWAKTFKRTNIADAPRIVSVNTEGNQFGVDRVTWDATTWTYPDEENQRRSFQSYSFFAVPSQRDSHGNVKLNSNQKFYIYKIQWNHR